MKNTTQNSIYNPCESCTHREYLRRCPFEKRTTCAQFVFSQYLNIIENGGVKVPDEVLVSLLRKNGWHGEIRQQITVRI